MAFTATQRKKRQRNGRRAKGWVPVTVWVYPDQKPTIRAIEKRLQEEIRDYEKVK